MLKSDFYEFVESLMTRATQNRVKRQAKVKCLQCDKAPKHGCRGLCSHHYNQFRYARKIAASQGMKALKKFEQEEVTAGRVLGSKRGKVRKDPNTFLGRLATN